jgi:hypothetical protein
MLLSAVLTPKHDEAIAFLSGLPKRITIVVDNGAET